MAYPILARELERLDWHNSPIPDVDEVDRQIDNGVQYNERYRHKLDQAWPVGVPSFMNFSDDHHYDTFVYRLVVIRHSAVRRPNVQESCASPSGGVAGIGKLRENLSLDAASFMTVLHGVANDLEYYGYVFSYCTGVIAMYDGTTQDCHDVVLIRGVNKNETPDQPLLQDNPLGPKFLYEFVDHLKIALEKNHDRRPKSLVIWFVHGEGLGDCFDGWISTPLKDENGFTLFQDVPRPVIE